MEEEVREEVKEEEALTVDDIINKAKNSNAEFMPNIDDSITVSPSLTPEKSKTMTLDEIIATAKERSQEYMTPAVKQNDPAPVS